MRNNRKPTAGIGYFNLARGLGILCILLGHTANLYLKRPEYADAGVFSGIGGVMGGGLMAAFFLVSGYGFFRRSMKRCVSLQSRLLLKPYLWTAAAVLATKLLLAIVERRPFREHGGELVLTYLLGLNAEGGGTFLGARVDSVSILWFILALYGGWLLYNAIRGIRSEWICFFCSAGCMVLGWLLTLFSKVWPYCLPMIFLAVGLLWCGDFIRRHELLERRLPLWGWLLIWIPAGLSAAFGYVNFVAGVWRAGLLDVLGVCCWGFLFLRLYAWFMKRGRRGKIIALLEEAGLCSIWIVCLHAYEKVIVPWHWIPAMLPERPGLGICLCMAVRCLLMYGLYRLILFARGKWKQRKRSQSRLAD